MVLLLNYLLIPLPFSVASKEPPMNPNKQKLEAIVSEYLYLSPRLGIRANSTLHAPVKEMAQPSG